MTEIFKSVLAKYLSTLETIRGMSIERHDSSQVSDKITGNEWFQALP